ncbi:hypothetical protein ACU4GI_09210 [Cupriavidus basilensis]
MQQLFGEPAEAPPGFGKLEGDEVARHQVAHLRVAGNPGAFGAGEIELVGDIELERAGDPGGFDLALERGGHGRQRPVDDPAQRGIRHGERDARLRHWREVARGEFVVPVLLDEIACGGSVGDHHEVGIAGELVERAQQVLEGLQRRARVGPVKRGGRDFARQVANGAVGLVTRLVPARHHFDQAMVMVRRGTQAGAGVVQRRGDQVDGAVGQLAARQFVRGIAKDLRRYAKPRDQHGEVIRGDPAVVPFQVDEVERRQVVAHHGYPQELVLAAPFGQLRIVATPCTGLTGGGARTGRIGRSQPQLGARLRRAWRLGRQGSQRRQAVAKRQQ